MKNLVLLISLLLSQLSIALNLGAEVEGFVISRIQREVVSAELWVGPFSEKEMFEPIKKIRLDADVVSKINKASKTLVWKDSKVVVTRDAVDCAIVLTYADGDSIGLWLGPRYPNGFFSLFFGEGAHPVAAGLIDLQMIRKNENRDILAERHLTWDWKLFPREGGILEMLDSAINLDGK